MTFGVIRVNTKWKLVYFVTGSDGRIFYYVKMTPNIMEFTPASLKGQDESTP